MDVDHQQESGSGEPSTPLTLTHIWANRASRHEREDEDLVPDPGSPELTEDEDETEGSENLDPDEPEFLSDDEEPPTHVEISPMEQLTADFQLRAAEAGMLVLRLSSVKCISLKLLFCA